MAGPHDPDATDPNLWIQLVLFQFVCAASFACIGVFFPNHFGISRKDGDQDCQRTIASIAESPGVSTIQGIVESMFVAPQRAPFSFINPTCTAGCRTKHWFLHFFAALSLCPWNKQRLKSTDLSTLLKSMINPCETISAILEELHVMLWWVRTVKQRCPCNRSAVQDIRELFGPHDCWSRPRVLNNVHAI